MHEPSEHDEMVEKIERTLMDVVEGRGMAGRLLNRFLGTR
jgi:hypothetical protein